MQAFSVYFCKKVNAMAYIKKLKYNELVGGTDNTDVYPVTSTEAVYGPDNISQQAVNEDRLRRIELLENNVHSLDGLKEMVEALISGDYDHHGGLSDNNFTDELKAKLEGLENYNDAELRQLLNDIDTAKVNVAEVYTKEEIDDKLGDIQGALTFDNTPTAGSDNPVKSSGIKDYVDSHQVTTDAAPTQGSSNPVSSGGVYTALQGKQDTISDIDTIRNNASNAASITKEKIDSWDAAAAGGGTITGITMNGSSKGTSGVVDLGTVVTQETDPTVPQWAKAANKPPYTAQEVGALPADTQFMSINGTSVKSNNSINVYTQTAADSKFASKTELSGYATETYVNNAIADVAYLGDDDGQATTLDFDPQADTVWNKAQTLGSAQQAQARNNIGAVGSVTVNGTTYTPTNGNVNLGTVGGGDVNVIETVKVNGTALVPDANKAVDVNTHDAVVNHGTSDTTFALTPNVLHVWGTVTALTLTLATPTDSTIVNEYMFQFTSGSTATTLSLPSTVTWVAAPSINAGATYQVSIVNNLGIIAEFSETA